MSENQRPVDFSTPLLHCQQRQTLKASVVCCGQRRLESVYRFVRHRHVSLVRIRVNHKLAVES